MFIEYLNKKRIGGLFGKLIIIVFCGFILTGLKCSSDDIIASKLDDFCQKWVHSHEEDQSEEVHFRTDDFDFPPSRGRVAMHFSKDGTMIYHGISPVDAIEKFSGKWSKKEKNIIEVSLDKKDSEKYRFEVLVLSKELMKIKYIN